MLYFLIKAGKIVAAFGAPPPNLVGLQWLGASPPDQSYYPHSIWAMCYFWALLRFLGIVKIMAYNLVLERPPRAQPRRAKGTEAPPLARSKLRKKVRILADFEHTTPLKCYCKFLQQYHIHPVIKFCCILACEGAIFFKKY